MKRYSLRDLWKSITGGQPWETSSGASPCQSNGTDMNNMTNIHSSEDFALNMVSVMPAQPNARLDSQVSDGDKTGATLLFSGIFLGLVGMTFTTMGWMNYEVSNSFEWTQLLGPILLSVGGTFVLISICKFRMFSCQACMPQNDETVPEVDLPPLSGPSFVFSGVNQPITFHRATVVQYIPPPYASVEQERSLSAVNGFQSSQQSVTVRMSTPPQYYSIYPLENSAFSGDNDIQVQSDQTRETRYGASVLFESKKHNHK